MALVTNLRDRRLEWRGERSRGELVRAFLTGGASPAEFVDRVAAEADTYRPFNLVVGTLGARPELVAINAVERQSRRLGPGVHAISNGYLDDLWPKMRRAREGVREDSEELFALLGDRRVTLRSWDARASSRQ